MGHLWDLNPKRIKEVDTSFNRLVRPYVPELSVQQVSIADLPDWSGPMMRLYTINCTGQVLVDKHVALYCLSDGLGLTLLYHHLTCTHKAGHEWSSCRLRLFRQYGQAELFRGLCKQVNVQTTYLWLPPHSLVTPNNQHIEHACARFDHEIQGTDRICSSACGQTSFAIETRVPKDTWG